ncbi:MAG: Gfo/Idh/MocA family oxidoreductase [candidate division WS1 bacterium]|nr:Gfo/Idh/MocA family oxidoreductase [candidate division WS1 bacterium]
MPVRWAIIGCGDIANKAVAPAINGQPDSELVAFFSNTPQRAEQMRDEHGAERALSDLDELLAADDIDAVYVASPVNRHAPETIAALQAGKHVLCEKPMALSVADAERMIAMAEEAGLRLGVAYYRRFFPVSRKIRELLDAQAIGKPIVCEISICSRPMITADNPKYWRLFPEQAGGGALMDVGSHRLDLACYFLGEPATVTGLTDRLDRDDMAVPDIESLLCRMQCGTHLHCTASWAISARADELMIRGTEGAIEARNYDRGPLVLRRGESVESFDLPPGENWHAPLIDDFARALVEGREPQITGRDGILATRIIEGCYRSSETGKTMEV